MIFIEESIWHWEHHGRFGSVSIVSWWDAILASWKLYWKLCFNKCFLVAVLLAAIWKPILVLQKGNHLVSHFRWCLRVFTFGCYLTGFSFHEDTLMTSNLPWSYIFVKQILKYHKWISSKLIIVSTKMQCFAWSASFESQNNLSLFAYAANPKKNIVKWSRALPRCASCGTLNWNTEEINLFVQMWHF